MFRQLAGESGNAVQEFVGNVKQELSERTGGQVISTGRKRAIGSTSLSHIFDIVAQPLLGIDRFDQFSNLALAHSPTF